MKLPADTFPFLTELANNNHREWFNEHKLRFNALQNDLIDYIDVLINELIPLEPLLLGVRAKDCLFRIQKDARFAKGQEPYKTHFGIRIVTSGRRADFEQAGIYLRIKPNECVVGGGTRVPSSARLRQIRQKISVDGGVLESILADKVFKKYFGVLQGESLIRPPAGFTQDAPHLDLLRKKAFTVHHFVADEMVGGAKFLPYFVKLYETYLPLQRFLNGV